MYEDATAFRSALQNAIAIERGLHVPETTRRNRLEAVEETLAELHAARESGRMDALRVRYLPYAPELILPQQYDGWRGKLCGYADGVRSVLRRLVRREVSMTDTQVAGLLGRVGAAVTSVSHGSEAGIPPTLLPVDAGFPSPAKPGDGFGKRSMATRTGCRKPCVPWKTWAMHLTSGVYRAFRSIR